MEFSFSLSAFDFFKSRKLIVFIIFRGRKLNSHLERAIQKAMTELDKQSCAKKVCTEKKAVTSSHKTPKSKLVRIAPAPDKK